MQKRVSEKSESLKKVKTFSYTRVELTSPISDEFKNPNLVVHLLTI
jgi:hypothetical protein